MSKKLVKRVVFVVTLITVASLLMAQQRLTSLTKKIDVKLAEEKAEKEASQKELKELQTELGNMDSLDYIEKIAKEQLGMVQEDTIVIKEK